jgi:hypothetical protein
MNRAVQVSNSSLISDWILLSSLISSYFPSLPFLPSSHYFHSPSSPFPLFLILPSLLSSTFLSSPFLSSPSLMHLSVPPSTFPPSSPLITLAHTFIHLSITVAQSAVNKMLNLHPKVKKRALKVGGTALKIIGGMVLGTPSF